jgi:hypothetical protein
MWDFSEDSTTSASWSLTLASTSPQRPRARETDEVSIACGCHAGDPQTLERVVMGLIDRAHEDDGTQKVRAAVGAEGVAGLHAPPRKV